MAAGHSGPNFSRINYRFRVGLILPRVKKRVDFFFPFFLYTEHKPEKAHLFRVYMLTWNRLADEKLFHTLEKTGGIVVVERRGLKMKHY